MTFASHYVVVVVLAGEEARWGKPGLAADDGQGCSIELVDDVSSLDGEVSKRPNDMVPVPVSNSALFL